MMKHIKILKSRVNSLKWGVRFGSDYVVAAVPIRNSSNNNNSNNIEQKIPMEGSHKYSSPVQEQTEVFPIDEDSEED